MKIPQNSRILQKLKPENSVSGISKIFRYPECGQKKAAVKSAWYPVLPSNVSNKKLTGFASVTYSYSSRLPFQDSPESEALTRN